MEFENAENRWTDGPMPGVTPSREIDGDKRAESQAGLDICFLLRHRRNYWTVLAVLNRMRMWNVESETEAQG